MVTIDRSHKQLTKIEKISDSVEILDLWNNQITKIENIPDNVKKLYLERNPCCKIIKDLSTDKIKWMSNFDKIVLILKDYLINKVVNVIQNYSVMNDLFKSSIYFLK